MSVLELQSIIGGYGETQILKGVSMRVDKGEIVVVIGPNGAGKSTSLKAVFGLLNLTSGKILLEDEDIKGTCKVKMLLAKQRDGISGIDINLAFNKLHQRMDLWPKVEAGDVQNTVPQPALPYADAG